MRNLGLDILRLLAILLVLGRHLLELPRGWVFEAWHRGGWVGVDLFFVLSGFLVSGLLFREHLRSGRVNLSRFMIRRGLKIYPAFFVMMVGTLLVGTVQRASVPARDVLGDLIFLQNYVGGMWDHTWSLAVEEHFYLALVAMIWWLRRPASHVFEPIPRIFLTVAVLCLSARILTSYIFPYSHRLCLFPTHLRIDSLLFGVLLSYLWHFHGLKARSAKIPTSALVAAGALLLSPAFVFDLKQYRFVSVYGLCGFYVGSGALVLAAMRLEGSGNGLLRFLGVLGAASYSVYLWHFPLNIWIHAAMPGASAWGYLAVYFGASVAFGLLMSKVVEWPVLRVRDRLFPSQ